MTRLTRQPHEKGFLFHSVEVGMKGIFWKMCRMDWMDFNFGEEKSFQMKFTFAQTFMLDLNQTQSLQLIKASIFLEPSELTLHKISLLLYYFSLLFLSSST